MNNGKKIVIVRHGETEWNTLRKLQGQEDSSLTSLGKKQTSLVAKALENERYDICISSDLERCKLTTKMINKNRIVDTIYEKRLRERNFGKLQGMNLAQIQEKYPQIFKKLKKGNINFEVPEGESMFRFYTRISDYMQFLHKNITEKNILIISHGGVLDCIMRNIMNLTLDDHRCFSIYNTSINRFSVNKEGWKLECWGDINHLNELTSIDDF